VANSPDQVDSNVHQLLTRLADRPGPLKTRLSEVGMSTNELKIATESVIDHAQIFKLIRVSANAMEAYVADRISLICFEFRGEFSALSIIALSEVSQYFGRSLERTRFLCKTKSH